MQFITTNRKKMKTNIGDGKSKIGSLSHFKGKNKKKKFNKKSRELNVVISQKTNCRRKKKSRKTQDFNRID